MKVPWASLYIDKNELNEVVKVVKSGQLSQGPKVALFESMVQRLMRINHAIAVNSGTAALDIALKILGINPGDEVIVPAFTYIASANCILYQNATPVFCDVDQRTFTIDPKDAERKITKKTKCIIAVNYGGQAADFDLLKAIARKHSLPIVEDNAPGFGGEYKGKKLGSLGTIGITSFHAAKIMSTVEGGMIFTNSSQMEKRIRIIRSQGEDPHQKYHHPELGHNYRMTDLFAAIGIVQLKRLKALLDKRAKLAAYYNHELSGVRGITLPHVEKGNKHAWFLYPILIKNRNKVRKFLYDKKIETNISWPMPVYDQKPYRKFKRPTCPISERLTREILCLPMFYMMSRKQQYYVVENLIKAIKQASR